MINWREIDTVLLDMDGTLLDLHFDNFFWTEYLPKLYAHANQLREIPSIEALQSQLSIERGTLNWYCVDHWSKQLGMDIPVLKRELGHMITLRPFALEFLQELKRGDYTVVMVTNSHRKALDIKMEQINLHPWFDHLVVSHDLHAAKEEQAFWHGLQELHPFDPARSLLIDDTESVLRSAEQFGIAHLVTMLQPDSQRQMRLNTTFPGIHHFDEIMPGGTST